MCQYWIELEDKNENLAEFCKVYNRKTICGGDENSKRCLDKEGS